MEAPKRGRGRTPRISKPANEKLQDQQPGAGADMMDVEPATRAGRVQPARGREGASSAADTSEKAPKRGREPSAERYSRCMVEDFVPTQQPQQQIAVDYALQGGCTLFPTLHNHRQSGSGWKISCCALRWFLCVVVAGCGGRCYAGVVLSAISSPADMIFPVVVYSNTRPQPSFTLLLSKQTSATAVVWSPNCLSYKSNSLHTMQLDDAQP